MEDFRVCGYGDMVIVWDSHGFFCGCGMGMGTEIQSSRQPWLKRTSGVMFWRLRMPVNSWSSYYLAYRQQWQQLDYQSEEGCLSEFIAADCFMHHVRAIMLFTSCRACACRVCVCVCVCNVFCSRLSYHPGCVGYHTRGLTSLSLCLYVCLHYLRFSSVFFMWANNPWFFLDLIHRLVLNRTFWW